MATKRKKRFVLLALVLLVPFLIYKFTPLGALFGNLTGQGNKFSADGNLYERNGETVTKNGVVFNSEATDLTKVGNVVQFTTKTNHTWTSDKGWIS